MVQLVNQTLAQYTEATARSVPESDLVDSLKWMKLAKEKNENTFI